MGKMGIFVLILRFISCGMVSAHHSVLPLECASLGVLQFYVPITNCCLVDYLLLF